MCSFTVSLSGCDPGVAEVHGGAHRPICVGLPAESGEQPDVWCPEQLLAASVGSCLMASFRHCLRQRGGEAHTYLGVVRTTLGRTRSGFRITRIDVSSVVGVDGEGNLALAREAVCEAERNCAVSCSLACPVKVTWELNNASREGKRKEADTQQCRPEGAEAESAGNVPPTSRDGLPPPDRCQECGAKSLNPARRARLSAADQGNER